MAGRSNRVDLDDLLDSVDAATIDNADRVDMSPRAFRSAALVGLVVLTGLSAAFALVPVVGMPHGYLLALVKILVLAFLFSRVVAVHVYTMQWSSMLILLFMAEGTVRAMSDPQPVAALGALEAVAATAYFVAVLAYLRPLKKAAKRPKDRSP